MGNSCCRGEATSSSLMKFSHNSTEKESLLDDLSYHSSLPSSKYYSGPYDQNHHVYRELKIKITKEKLEELFGTTDVHDMSVDQILARLIGSSADQFHYYDDHNNHHLDFDSLHHHAWRPALQTIPEVN